MGCYFLRKLTTQTLPVVDWYVTAELVLTLNNARREANKQNLYEQGTHSIRFFSQKNKIYRLLGLGFMASV